jgi:hypothetical protein
MPLVGYLSFEGAQLAELGLKTILLTESRFCSSHKLKGDEMKCLPLSVRRALL